MIDNTHINNNSNINNGSGMNSKTPDNGKHTLSDMARGVQHAVNTAQEVLELHYVRLLARYFDEDNNPKMVRLNVSNDSIIEVPLISLISPHELKLDELTMDLSLRIDETKIKRIPRKEGGAVERTSFQISVGGGKTGNGTVRDRNVLDIKMVFKSGDPPEGVSRIVEEFTRRIVAKKLVEKPETEQDKWKI